MFLETFIPYLAAAVLAFLLGLYIGRNSSTKVISKPTHNKQSAPFCRICGRLTRQNYCADCHESCYP